MELGYYLLQYKYFNLKTLYFSLFQILVSSLESLFTIYIKGLMEFKYSIPHLIAPLILVYFQKLKTLFISPFFFIYY